MVTDLQTYLATIKEQNGTRRGPARKRNEREGGRGRRVINIPLTFRGSGDPLPLRDGPGYPFLVSLKADEVAEDLLATQRQTTNDSNHFHNEGQIELRGTSCGAISAIHKRQGPLIVFSMQRPKNSM